MDQSIQDQINGQFDHQMRIMNMIVREGAMVAGQNAVLTAQIKELQGKLDAIQASSENQVEV